jgi:transcriptional regulator with XRE-family HTH domain
VALGARLRRVQGRLTAQAFADALGVHAESMRRYLKGQGIPAMLLVRVMERFDVDAGWLLTGRETPAAALLTRVSTDRLLAEVNLRASAEEHRREMERVVRGEADPVKRGRGRSS